MTARYIAVLAETRTSPGEWAAAREAEGWDGVAVSDHAFMGTQPLPHVWVTAAEMAGATSRATIATCFANNLMRSPVEFAQASLALQRTSGGRFEAGLGAGWDQAEMEAIGLTFPADVGERAGRYIEAGRVVRALFDDRTLAFTGRWYELQVPAIGPDVVSPPLVVSVGGKRTTAALAPIADIVEVKLPGFATTGKGPLHVRSLRAVTLAEVAERLDEVRALNPSAVPALFVNVGCGNDPLVHTMRGALAGSFSEHLYGDPAEVADMLGQLAGLGARRITLGALTDTSYRLLAPALAAGRG